MHIGVRAVITIVQSLKNIKEVSLEKVVYKRQSAYLSKLESQ